MAKIKIVEADIIPICPFCKEDLPVINKTSKGLFDLKKIFTCPHCRAVLGIGSDLTG